ncbi:winged helix DNA-binding domain-containing protein [soil metagenome]
MVEAAESVVCLHATDPSTVYLSAWARTEEMAVADLDRALYADRSLLKHLAMRRTLWVLPRATVPFAQAGASERVAGAERRRLIKEVEGAGVHRDGERWLEGASGDVLAALAGGREATSTELRAEIPSLEGSITYGEGKSWAGEMPLGPRVLNVLHAGGEIVRASNDGAWTASRPRWASAEAWLGEEIPAPAAAEGTDRMVKLWLRAFGPGTEADIKWWLGSTLRAVRAALASLEAVEVAIDGGTGYVMPGDLEPAEEVDPWAALLPSLDPTTMGWLERDWYLGGHKKQVFDSNGNAGPTVWWNGRIVGGWRQRDGGEVDVQLLEDAGAEAAGAIELEAARLTDWLAGTRVLPRFPSPLFKS